MSTTKLNHVIQIAVMAAIMLALSFIPGIPIGPTPIVLENLGVMLAGLLLGTTRGTISVLLFILLKIIGISSTASGIFVLVGPNCGYIYGWLVLPFLINLFMKIFKKHLNVIVIFIIVALVSVIVNDFLAGTAGLFFVTGMPFMKIIFINVAVTPGDVIKALVAAIVYWQAMNSTHMKNLLS